MGVTALWHRALAWSDGNVLELNKGGIVQHCEWTKFLIFKWLILCNTNFMQYFFKGSYCSVLMRKSCWMFVAHFTPGQSLQFMCRLVSKKVTPMHLEWKFYFLGRVFPQILGNKNEINVGYYNWFLGGYVYSYTRPAYN